MENLDFLSNLAMMEDTELEEKVDIDVLLLPAKPKKSAEIDSNDIKQEPLEKKQQAAFESDHDEEKKFILQMEALRTFPWKEP